MSLLQCDPRNRQAGITIGGIAMLELRPEAVHDEPQFGPYAALIGRFGSAARIAESRRPRQSEQIKIKVSWRDRRGRRRGGSRRCRAGRRGRRFRPAVQTFVENAGRLGRTRRRGTPKEIIPKALRIADARANNKRKQKSRYCYTSARHRGAPCGRARLSRARAAPFHSDFFQGTAALPGIQGRRQGCDQDP